MHKFSMLTTLLLLVMTGSACEKIVDEAKSLQARVLPKKAVKSAVEEAEEAYETVKKIGDAKTRCVRAGLVAEAFEAQGDEKQAAKWRKTQARDCETAGLPAL